jgi:hypothetical protein
LTDSPTVAASASPRTFRRRTTTLPSSITRSQATAPAITSIPWMPS